MDNDIFTIQARKCLRCGRLLTSKAAVEKGYGCQCFKKNRTEEIEKQPLPGQMDLSEFLREEEDH